MKIAIEYWKKEKRFNKKVSSLFDESIICYKHGAYRASLMFSYLAFLTFIKETIIKSNKPASINQPRWDSILNDLQNDDKWEKRVFEELTNSSTPIFSIKENLRQQIKYWKDRRNDCAHFKDNEIDAHHVESFWSFLKSNLSKTNIEGGRQNLLLKFRDHFDTTKTPPNSDFSHLITEIEHAVDNNEIKDFFADLINFLDPIGWGEPTVFKILNKSFELCTDQVTEKLKEYILDNKLDIKFISYYPDKINSFGFTATEIRELWKKRIFQNGNDRYMFDIYSALIRNSLIPQSELSEAFATLFDKYEQTRHSFPSKPEVIMSLKDDILGDIIYTKAIVNDKLNTFMWVNSKTDFIAFYIEHFTVKKETVEALFAMVGRQNFSWWLRDAVVRILSSNSTKKSEIHTIATTNGIAIPTEFQ